MHSPLPSNRLLIIPKYEQVVILKGLLFCSIILSTILIQPLVKTLAPLGKFEILKSQTFPYLVIWLFHSINQIQYKNREQHY